MAFTFNAVHGYALATGADRSEARYGVKRSKNATADGSTVDMRLRSAPDSLDPADMGAAAMHGVDIAGTGAGGSYARGIALSGAAARAVIVSALTTDSVPNPTAV